MRSVRLTDSSPTGAASSRPDRPPPVETPRETSRPERLRETCQPRRRRRLPRIGGEPRERSRPVASQRAAQPRRSEERRVGKECRSRGWAYHDKKKKRSSRLSKSVE